MDPFPGSIATPSSLIHYPYAAGDPINVIDPSGDAWEFNQRNGAAAHALFSLYAMTLGLTPTWDFPLSTVAGWYGYNYFDGDPDAGALKPDVVDFEDKTYFELKPITHRNSPTYRQSDVAQLQNYQRLLSPLGFSAGDQNDIATGATPIGTLLGSDGNRYILFISPADSEDNSLGGLVYYWTRPLPRNLDPSLVPAPRSPIGALNEKAIEESARYGLELFDKTGQEIVSDELAWQDALDTVEFYVNSVAIASLTASAGLGVYMAVVVLTSTTSGVAV